MTSGAPNDLPVRYRILKSYMLQGHQNDLPVRYRILKFHMLQGRELAGWLADGLAKINKFTEKKKNKVREKKAGAKIREFGKLLISGRYGARAWVPTRSRADGKKTKFRKKTKRSSGKKNGMSHKKKRSSGK